MSQCDTNLVRRLEEDFKITLQQQNSLEEWANWLKGVVDEVLKPYIGKRSYIKAARQFLLKWSFYRWVVGTVRPKQVTVLIRIKGIYKLVHYTVIELYRLILYENPLKTAL